LPIYEPAGNGCSCSAGPECSSPAKHPRWHKDLCAHGLESATTDPILIRRMAAMWPAANIAIRCDGLVVIDVDGDEGRAEYRRLLEEHGGVPETLMQKTARGGHVFFASDDADSYLSRARFLPGLDIRAGRHAYVLMAPSRHASGKTYRLVKRETEIVVLPPWLDAILPRRTNPTLPTGAPPIPVPTHGQTPYGRKALEGIAADLAATPDGARNDGLNRLAFRAGQLVIAGHLSEEDAHATLAKTATDIGLGAREVLKTWMSGFRSGLKCPDSKTPTPRAEVDQPLATVGRAAEDTIMAKDAQQAGGPASHGDKDLPWPAPLGPAAFHGLVGDVVRFIDPETEADPVAVLVQFLVCFGSVIGRRPHWVVESHRHGMNMFMVLVGRSSRSRKGTSLRHVRALFRGVDAAWGDEHIKSGLSTGEGLIYHVRDASTTWDGEQEREVIIDPGVQDKRLLLMEDEFAQPLKVMQREGNTLSPVVRRAWDGDKLSTLTKKNAICATDTHVSLIGHITRQEVLRLITETDATNGFVNRFLWVCSRRSKELPFGGKFHEKDTRELTSRIAGAVGFARQVDEIGITEAAKKLWEGAYHELTADASGFFASVISRAEAQTVRLACLYSLLDESHTIEVSHLEAALEVWRYCEDSARHVFGGLLGDPVADRILKGLRAAGDKGLRLTEINKILSGHLTSERIASIVTALKSQGLAEDRVEKTGGRSGTRWFATTLFPLMGICLTPPAPISCGHGRSRLSAS
ncbi:MAG: bifunctional DNA primase/polymerase, partial [Deltaproteobacteria bacterium]|nr:bifunctional DNA primase/polymerase [Deltaproteobacteria bacterium]